MHRQQPAETPPDEAGERGTDLTQRAEVRPGYLAFVAHEMRNPLATALWSAELLVRLAPADRAGPRGEKLAGMCLRTLGRLRHIMEDHFLVDRLAISGIPLRLEPVALAEALDGVAKRSGTQCERALGVASVPADKAMIERALEALVVAAARDGTPVRVDSAAEDGRIVVRVSGAPPLPEALHPPDRSTAPDPTGRALGLLMASAVAHAHHGRLAVSADGYVLTLPATAPQRPEDGS